MQVKLKVIGGKHDGREIGISVPEFLIGRANDAHLRPNSDLISREHCSIKVVDGKVLVKDLGSRNGTLVNGKRLEVEYAARPGDILRVGQLQFEFIIDVAQPSSKKPKVQDVADAVARTGAASGNNGDSVSDDSITDWLSQPSETPSSHSLTDTQQFRFDEPTKLFQKSEEKPKDSTDEPSSAELEADSTDEPKSGRHKKKRKPGKLPSKPREVAESSKSAADDVLRKFFNRR